MAFPCAVATSDASGLTGSVLGSSGSASGSGGRASADPFAQIRAEMAAGRDVARKIARKLGEPEPDHYCFKIDFLNGNNPFTLSISCPPSGCGWIMPEIWMHGNTCPAIGINDNQPIRMTEDQIVAFVLNAKKVAAAGLVALNVPYRYNYNDNSDEDNGNDDTINNQQTNENYTQDNGNDNYVTSDNLTNNQPITTDDPITIDDNKQPNSVISMVPFRYSSDEDSYSSDNAPTKSIELIEQQIAIREQQIAKTRQQLGMK